MTNTKHYRHDVASADAHLGRAIDAVWAIAVTPGEPMSRQQSMLERLVEIRKELDALNKELRDA